MAIILNTHLMREVAKVKALAEKPKCSCGRDLTYIGNVIEPAVDSTKMRIIHSLACHICHKGFGKVEYVCPESFLEEKQSVEPNTPMKLIFTGEKPIQYKKSSILKWVYDWVRYIWKKY